MASIRLPEPFIFTKSELETNSPSRLCGLSAEEEQKRRQYSLQLAQASSCALQLPHIATVTTLLLLQRFYAVKSFTLFPDVQWVVCTCIFLAAKLEEDPRRASDVLNAVHRILLPATDASVPSILQSYEIDASQDPSKLISSSRELLLLGEEYFKAKEKLIEYEQEVLRALQFQVGVSPPHKHLLNFARFLHLPQSLTQLAYAALNDCLLYTTLCLQYPPAVLAASALNLAALLLEVAHELPSEWWIALDGDLDMLLLEEIGHVLLDVYKKARVVN
mmetsp:Transcript_27997/g.38721  ORF Transcript_27997/g.38721 Transcript_27997/m.38721 type:complete len:276 (-) Transcript_27997:324-1151(-)|eukprot:CAMPEP_0196580660 /NCGR_PEP_ID=MMETSP1081-20130531/29879_1 /TAXON_ID=36882 /ORGANISM="Pyramimonas amylifera, Strain CCMP720" /LENGTH=275 /DNA_ID=CAMNT_0041900585 /DNA_START=68 /DNA_END=895 /DNA_ORIENTATION=-